MYLIASSSVEHDAMHHSIPMQLNKKKKAGLCGYEKKGSV